MSELALQEAVQDILQTMPEFADASIVINDWSVLDQSTANAPYVIISNADDFTSRQDSVDPATTWQIPVALYERFTDWPTTLGNLRARRQAIIDKFNAVGSARSAGGLEAVTADEIRNDGPIQPYFGPYVEADQVDEALPLFLMQSLVLSFEEF